MFPYIFLSPYVTHTLEKLSAFTAFSVSHQHFSARQLSGQQLLTQEWAQLHKRYHRNVDSNSSHWYSWLELWLLKKWFKKTQGRKNGLVTYSGVLHTLSVTSMSWAHSTHSKWWFPRAKQSVDFGTYPNVSMEIHPYYLAARTSACMWSYLTRCDRISPNVSFRFSWVMLYDTIFSGYQGCIWT